MSKPADDLRKSADHERDRSNWPAASYYYSKALEFEPNDAGMWVQHGHMLKETGLFEQARVSYDRALTLTPHESELHLQLAILCKIQGRFEEAQDGYGRASSLGYQPEAFIRKEVKELARTKLLPIHDLGDPATIYLSSASLPQAENDPVSLKQFIGAAHYSYAYIMRGYRDALEQAGYKCKVVQSPEYLPNIRSDGTPKVSLHIGFYPPDGARYLKGAYNVICIAWEFERLISPVELNSYHAFVDPVDMLAGADETWVISTYGAQAARSSGVRNVVTVPTPVVTTRQTGRNDRPTLAELQQLALRFDRVAWEPLAVWPSLQPMLSQQSRSRRAAMINALLDLDSEQPPAIFLCVFNVHDFRKQMKPVIEAFVRITQRHPGAYLLLKVSCIDSEKLDVNRMLLMEQIADAGEMTAPLVSDRILLTTDVLSRDELNALYDMATYYICSSHAEGQNLPLIEAMGRGVVPVSVDHTAMADYIVSENAIIIPSNLAPLTQRLVQRYGLYGVNTYYVEARDAYAALDQAITLPAEDYARMSNGAVAAVSAKFGVSAFGASIQRVLATIKARSHGVDR